MKLLPFFLLLFLSLTFCVKKEADGKAFCEKNCKSACATVGGNVGKCVDDCIPACENAGPNPFYKGN